MKGISGLSVSKNHQGYLRIKSRGPHRDKMEHRYVVETLLGSPIPTNFEIHHEDKKRDHNCPANLIMYQSEIHEAIERSHRRYVQIWGEEIPF